MTDLELIEQFKRCETWSDAEQWDLLAMAYYGRGYWQNALCCFKRADACRGVVAVETETVHASA